MQLVLIIVGVLIASGVFMQALTMLAASDFARRHRRRIDRMSRIEPAAHRRSQILNSVVSTSLFFAVPLIFRARLFTTAPVSAVRTIGEATAMILLYDFGYYLMHRFGFHSWSVGRRIHSVHHSIRTPYTPDSLYIHPAETAAGVSLFLVCMAIVGPVGVWSFALAFLVYSVTNLFIHSGLDLPFAPFNLLTAVVRHHDIHHDSMKAGYYASITPIWDLVFGTARHREEAAPAVS